MALAQIAYNLAMVAYNQGVLISLALTVLPTIFGVIVPRLSRGVAGLLQRLVLAVIGTIALISESRLMIGQVLTPASSVMPSRK